MNVARTTDTQWRHKSKISEKLGQCGRQNMLRLYLKIWEWEWIFGHAEKAISSLGVRSPCLQPSAIDPLLIADVLITLIYLALICFISQLVPLNEFSHCVSKKLYCHFLIFIDGKSIKVMISGFNLKKNEKWITRWHCGTKIPKTNIKTMISTIDKPLGVPGVSKNPDDQIEVHSGELKC